MFPRRCPMKGTACFSLVEALADRVCARAVIGLSSSVCLYSGHVSASVLRPQPLPVCRWLEKGSPFFPSAQVV